MPTLSASVCELESPKDDADVLTLVVLDPNVKLAYAQDKWDPTQLEDAINCLESVVRLLYVPMFLSLFLSESQFDSYYKPPVAPALDNNPVSAPSSSKVQYGDSWLRKILQTRQARDRSTGNPHEELRIYLEGPLAITKDIIAWWGVSRHVL
jgi:hypothetical protein